jgi:hypothetical protein
MNLILRLKSWQLFILIVIPLFFQPINLVFEIIYLFGSSVYLSWIFAIGSTMHSLLLVKSKPNIIYFKISCFSTALIILFSCFFNPSELLNPFADGSKAYFFWVFFAFVMASMFYFFGFAARMLQSKIDGEIANRSDSLRNFFYIWFFPIGIWYIQPMIKRALEKSPPTHVQ